ncbi:HRDC domain-containing protein [uncultured Desulfobacter sp.]|uniref:ribonuclease D n=1 Tax=uncultured Desulfobacter sp. TaxID=240139 RepID=UPI002AAAD5D0|nr:HRDC domain-containing protein [uncultured Desulfobacter sp.]
MVYQFVTTDKELAHMCLELEPCDIIGVDLEADSMHCFSEKICLIQIAGLNRAWLVDPFLVSDFSPFSRILENPGIIKVFHGSDFDVRSLDRELSVEIENLFDTEIACRFLNIQERGLGALLKSFFNIDVDKKYQKVDWSKRPLKDDMIAYSVGDVATLVQLHDLLKDRLEKMGRLAWAQEEFDLQARVKYESNHSRPLFKRFKGAGKLDNRSLAVLEHLLAVRLALAEKKDLPPFKIMSNQSIMAMVQHRPTSIDTVLKRQVLSPKQAGMYGQLCVEAIETALALPHRELPSYPKIRMPRKTPQILNRIDELKKMRETASRTLAMEPGFLINNNTIAAVATANPLTLDALGQIPGMRRWQVEALGDQILDTLSRTH